MDITTGIRRNVKKGIHQYSVIELIDVVETSVDEKMINDAKTELRRRKINDSDVEKAKSEYLKFKEYKKRRAEEPLGLDELIINFFMPFNSERNFADDELDRYNEYGFIKKRQQAIKFRLLGLFFYVLTVPLIIYFLNKYLF